ncbi:DNA metabolism protein [Antarcticibacterium flavum]|uniref:DNA metabolism protein n=1 Tax=Antarcticibacterium flavum TaxID=2058175 RepID=A0A5B7X6P0_9FLAO|nr:MULTISPECIES: TIGR03915 family putative DNA repair protein [Antarcticibacterium]MCM4158578.1 DNA metabolism protein [Antarcticibacterium sp. W02-3]QCY70321.1 DNA metabolism protein [Antarcticibacterium flavum]
MHQPILTLVYDGSLEGLFCCIFAAFEQKLKVDSIYTRDNLQPNMFSPPEEIYTDSLKAERVKSGLIRILGVQEFRRLYFAFQSEVPGMEMKILEFAQMAFTKKNFSPKDYGEPAILWVAKTAKMVSREKHRMEAFVRFKLTADEIYFAQIEPDFNVLPLIRKHFESRYADQKWLIFDKKRNYGIFFDLETTNFITFDNCEFSNEDALNDSVFDATEIEFEDLWQNYFNSTNIKSRKNLKLHNRHIPRRYWKYLSEKKPLHK